MAFPSSLSRRRSRRAGVAVCAGALALALALAYGLWRESYWALAIPVTVGTLGALALSFSVGWSIATVRGIPAQAKPYTGRGSLWAARAICLGSALLAAAFLWGVARGSFWALAIPVAAAVLGLLAMVFQIGWAVIRRRDTLPLKEALERERDAAVWPSGAEHATAKQAAE